MATKKSTSRKPAAKKTAAKKTISKTAAKTLAGKHMRARDKRKSYAALVKKYGRTIASRIVKMATKMEAEKAKSSAKKTSSSKKTTSARKKTTSARKTTKKSSAKKSTGTKKKITSAGRTAQGKKLAAAAKRAALVEFNKRKSALIAACKAHFKSAKTRVVGGKKLTPYAQWAKKVGNIQLAAMVYKACGMGK